MEQRYSEKVPPIIFADDFEEHHKICWRVEQAVPDPKNPLLSGKYPWDLGGPVLGGSGTILKDPIDGKYKGWVTSWASDVPEVLGEEEYILVGKVIVAGMANADKRGAFDAFSLERGDW